MKKYIAFFLVLAIGFVTAVQADASSKSVKFVTLGTCGICKSRIENAVKRTPGIVTVDWNIDEKYTAVEYDETQNDIYGIMHAVADAGHDAEWFRAPDAAYAFLVGTCCEYQRTIDYTKAQVGYLSLMGVWMSVNPENNNERPASVIQSTDTKGNLSLLIDGGNNDRINLAIYSLNGTSVFESQITGFMANRVDVSSLSAGCYIIILTNGNKIIYKTKTVVL